MSTPDYSNGPGQPAYPPQGDPQMTQGGYPPQQAYPPQYAPPGGSPKKSPTPIILGGVIALLLAVLAFVILSDRDTDTVSDYAATAPAAPTEPAAQEPAAAPTAVPAAPAAPPAQAAATPAPVAAPAAPAPRGYSGSVNITGQRQICHLYERTSVARFKGMSVCYEVNFNQAADGSIAGNGIKSVEYMPDGTVNTLTGAAQTPIRMTGAIDNNDLVSLSYTVQGASRATKGTATYSGRDQSEGDFIGSFKTDAANASGQARLTMYR